MPTRLAMSALATEMLVEKGKTSRVLGANGTRPVSFALHVAKKDPIGTFALVRGPQPIPALGGPHP
jgi:hypothetical protein